MQGHNLLIIKINRYTTILNYSFLEILVSGGVSVHKDLCIFNTFTFANYNQQCFFFKRTLEIHAIDCVESNTFNILTRATGT